MHKHYITRRKTLIFVASLLLGTLFLVILDEISTQLYYYIYQSSIHCYRIKSDSLPDISEVNPRRGKSIFFHETSCNSYYDGRISIKARQACAVESAAMMNPNFDVYLLYSSPGNISFEGSQSDRIIKALLSYKNVNMLHLDYEKYTEGTPVQDLYKNGFIENSEYAEAHASDVLRYLTLWKYGGIYLDLDVIVIKSLENFLPNFAGSESEQHVASGVLNFAPTGIGHDLAKMCLDDLKEHFDGHKWGHNGPGVITRLLRSVCGTEKAKDMIHKSCHGFSVYPTDAFYAVPWWNWTMYFDEKFSDAVVNLSKNSSAIHVWNKHSECSKIPVSYDAPYLLYAKEFCPKVMEQCDDYF